MVWHRVDTGNAEAARRLWGVGGAGMRSGWGLQRSLKRRRRNAQVAARDSVVDVLKRVFAVHGAVPLDSAYVGSCPVDAPPDLAAMLSPSGARLAMRCAAPFLPVLFWLPYTSCT